MEVKDKIEVGEYIRTYKGIARVVPEGIYVEIHEDKKMIYVDRNGIPCNWEFGCYVWSNEITKHSKNIIDLIEEGDYVNGCKVYKIEKNFITVYQEVGQETDYNYIPSNEVQTIVTKEQFKEMEYRVE